MSVLIGREGRRELVARLVERAGVDLSPAAAWLIVRLAEVDDAHPASIPQLCEDFDIPLEVGQRALRELDERGLLQRDPAAGEDRGRVVGVTPAGARDRRAAGGGAAGQPGADVRGVAARGQRGAGRAADAAGAGALAR